MQNGMGKPGLDFMHIQIQGVPVFAIETKAPGEKPTVRQERTIEEIRTAGGTVFVIDGDTTELEEWLSRKILLGMGTSQPASHEK